MKDLFIQLKAILEYKIIEVSNYSFTLYHIFLFVGIILVVRLLVKAMEMFVRRKVSGKEWIDEGKQFAIIQIMKYVMYAAGIIIGMKSIGLDITVLLFGSTALFVGLGFGLQEAFKDLVSGVILLFEGNVQVSDVIEMDNGIVGVVKVINLRTSKVRTRDGIMMVVPNSELINRRVVNWSNSNKLTRFHVTVGVAYGTDVEKVRDLLLEVAQKEDTITTRIPSFVRFSDFGDSALIFELHFWSEQVWRIENTKSNLRFEINKSFQQNKIQIPFPQRDLHIISDKRKTED
ncbi:mechanosensitive ion channel family protein [Acidiluteibacter ferrifornacis]|uniref:Mechanosensitive ion channel n=1 Tax=Acidiluteibacter ferrifornacis TaxID=2692424 RepID=A0A6N9NGD2_9FLAO|nr:mechanosensitive ion channel domain-containing protein [Acidiluteibacter ferrifornacis]MBR9830573.1 mechanosensitive ion channel [bacterium]NBG64591.1 mechanosensitive ion channel [Acidiluteibacter ferrifornacis]